MNLRIIVTIAVVVLIVGLIAGLIVGLIAMYVFGNKKKMADVSVNASPQTTHPSTKEGLPAKKKVDLKNIIIVVLIVAVLLCLFVILFRNGKSTSETEDKDKTTWQYENDTDDVTCQEGSDDNSGTEPQEAQNESSVYGMYNSQGDYLEAKPGYSKISYIKNITDTSSHESSISLPAIFNYTDDSFTMGEESETDGFYSLSFGCDGVVDIDFLEQYVNDLEQYGFTLAKKRDISNKHVIYYLNYNGSITHGADSLLEQSYDMSVTGYQDYLATYVVFRYPTEVSINPGDVEPVYNVIDISTPYEESDGKHKFSLNGWGEDSMDYLVIQFDSGYYHAGDVLSKEDFVSQLNAGDSQLCFLYISGKSFSRDNGFEAFQSKDVSDATVTILEESDSVLAISYDITLSSNSYIYQLEGVCTVDFGGGQAAYAADDTAGEVVESQKGIGHQDCSFCSGKGRVVCTSCNGALTAKCTKCSGRSLIQCSLCNGTGQHWSNGGFATCTNCFGHGSITCTACSNGRVTCTKCHGSGMVNCSYCYGKGWY